MIFAHYCSRLKRRYRLRRLTYSRNGCCICALDWVMERITFPVETPLGVENKEFRFCLDHAYRHELLQWGQQHNYPALRSEGFAVAAGLWHWGTTALCGTEDYVLAIYEATIAKKGAA